MKKLIYVVREVLDGNLAIDERKKYQVISVMISLVHLFFAVLFGILHINLLFIYNCIIVLYYIGMAFLIGRAKRYIRIFVSMFFEILFHSVMVTILLGWDWGFMIYTMGLVPVTFYIGYTIPSLKQRVEIPAVTSFIVFITYFIVKALTNHIHPILQGSYPFRVISFLYYFNTFLTFLFLWAISILFSLEIRFMKRSLELENHTLEKAANYDPLTHLLNRRSMDRYLTNAMELAEHGQGTFCLIMSDIDDFKKINDTYGHAGGDAVLSHVAKVLMGNVRDGDQVCRWGGEEMLILMRADKEVAIAVAKRICKDVASGAVIEDGVSIRVTLTLGVAEFRRGESIRSIINTADKHLYQGKKRGKNRVVA